MRMPVFLLSRLRFRLNLNLILNLIAIAIVVRIRPLNHLQNVIYASAGI